MSEDTRHQPPTRLEEVLGDILRGLGAALRVHRGVAVVLDPSWGRCRATAAVGLTEPDRCRVADWITTTADGRAYCAMLAAAAYPLHVAPPSDSDALAPHLAVPFVGSDGALRGIVALESGPPRPEDVALVAAMGRVGGIAIEQTAAAEANAAEAVRSAALLDIVREVDRRLDLPDVLAVICKKTVEAFGCQRATVFFHSRRHRASLPLADYGTPPEVAARFVGSRYSPGNIPHEAEVQEGRTVVINRAGDPSPDDLALLDQAETNILVLMPLRGDGGEVRGILNVGYTEPRDLTSEELRALEAVAHHAAMAILRARYLHTTGETARFRAAVSALAVELNATTSRAQSLQVLCARGSELFDVGAGMLYVQAGGRLVLAATYGAVPDAGERQIALAATKHPVVQAFVSGEVVRENDLGRAAPGDTGARLRSLLAIPLVGSEGRSGVLVFGDPRPRRFRPTMAEEAGVLGGLAAAVLRNLDLLGRLHESNERLRRVSTLKDQFLANVSHDLRTPLNVIIGYAQLALEDTFGVPTPDLRVTLGRMLASARQQLVLVQDLLDLSRLELNGLNVTSSPVALAPVFEEMEFVATNLLRDKPVRVAVEHVGRDVWVHADADRLRQVLTNLLSNAAKFTDEGTVGLRATRERDEVHIDVWDTGIGIPPEDHEAIFEPFRQVAGERAALGVGLGLAITRRLSELMGGTITVDSTLGRGSIFRLSLAAIAAPSAAVTTAERTAPPAS